MLFAVNACVILTCKTDGMKYYRASFECFCERETIIPGVSVAFVSVFFKPHITYLSLCSPCTLIWPLQLTGCSKPLSLLRAHALSLSLWLVLKGHFSRNLLLFALHQNNMQTLADKRMPQCTVLFILFNKLPLQNSQQLSPSSFTIRKSMYKSAACSETCIRSCHTKVVLNRTQTRSIRKQDYFQFHTKKVVFVVVCKQNMNLFLNHTKQDHNTFKIMFKYTVLFTTAGVFWKSKKKKETVLTKSQTHFQHSKSVLAPVSIIQRFFS